MHPVSRVCRRLVPVQQWYRCSAVSSATPVPQHNLSLQDSSRMDRAEWEQQLATRPAVVFYHYPCPDGVFAALAAMMYFQQRGVPVRYHPFEVYRETNLQDLQLQADEVAYLLDYCGPAGFPQQLAQHVSHVFALDHHKTAAEQLSDTSSHPPNLHVHLDMHRSGAMIAKNWFQPERLTRELSQMYEWIQDADLWRWRLPDSKAFHAGLAYRNLEYSVHKNPAIWDQLQQLNVDQLLESGKRVLQRQERLVADAVEKAKPHQLGGVQGLTCGWGACLGVTIQGELVKYRSQLGNQLAVRSKELGLQPVGLVAYTEADMPNIETHIKVSLRSIDGYDCSQISQAFGGGGHAAASSCVISREELFSWQAMGSEARRGAKQRMTARLASVIDSHTSST